ncbi:hypothetical protein D5S17_31880 [Pseudonocardiaceae bacterium YIM PH 21723]|nr:hypothetical protein D5S17_31880 [Pseudonocardiaceae bacterium YIM PH 21723]
MLFTRLATVGVLAAVTAFPASGMAALADQKSGTTLTLSRTPIAPDTLQPSGPTVSRTLNCDPVGGDHPQAAWACGVLNAAGGDPERIDLKAGICHFEAIGIEVAVSGSYQGRQLSWSRRSNGTCLQARFGDLFSFA